MELSKLLAAYLEIKRGEGLKAKTVVMYQSHISRFIESLPNHRRQLQSLAVADIARFIISEEERGMSINTRRARHRAIDVWLNWISDQDEYGNPPNLLRRSDGRLKLKPPRKPKHKPRRANLDDLKTVIASISLSDWIGLRDRVMLLLALDSGLRVGELCALEIYDVDIVERTVHVHHGKGDKERQVPFTTATATAIALYLMARPAIDPSLDYADRLFLSSYTAFDVGVRGPFGVSGAQQRLRNICKDVGVNHINWHSIRHLFGTKAINDGLRAETVSLLMGHSDVAFTRRTYAELLPETARAEYNQKWK